MDGTRARAPLAPVRFLRPLALALAPALVFALALAFLEQSGRLRWIDTGSSPVRVLEVVPRDLEVGQRVAILGEGFPAGKPARVTLRGTLRRPGERPVAGAEIVVPGTAVGPGRIEVVIDDAIRARICGAGERAMHTTFEGDVEVAFAGGAPHVGPSAGLLANVTLDARPGVTPPEREREGARALAFVGVVASRVPAGLLVQNVEGGSRGAAAGLLAGDVVTSFDGLRVASEADVLPAAGERTATVGLSRAGVQGASGWALPPLGETTVELSVDGFRRAAAADLLTAAAVVVGALLVVWLLAAPPRPSVDAALQRVVHRLRQRLGGQRGSWAGPWRALSAIARASLPASWSAVAADAVGCALLGVLPFGQYVVAARLDVGLLFLAAVAALAAAALAAQKSLWRGAVAAAWVVWEHVPVALAVVSVIAATGSLRVREIAGAQGGWPWEWLAFQSPAALLALGLLAGCLRTDPSGAAPGSSLAALVEDGSPMQRPGANVPGWFPAARSLHRVLVAGLASLLFLGGWLLPGVAAAKQGATLPLQILGTVWLLAKMRLVCAAMASIDWALPARRPELAWGRSLACAGLALAVLAGNAAWTTWGPGPAEQTLVSVLLVAAAVASGFAVLHRLGHGLSRASAEGHLSPFL